MMNTIKDKVIVILGVSSGIGEATVRLLAGKGAKPIIASPIYYHGVSGQLKCTLDRFYSAAYPRNPTI